MNLHKMIEICLVYDNMHRFVMINALICINIYVITCINSMLSNANKCCEENAISVFNLATNGHLHIALRLVRVFSMH